MLRVRFFTPEKPHGSSHLLQADHSETLQSMGQLVSLQPFDCFSAGQPPPPAVACFVMVRLRSVEPPPHVFEHEAHTVHFETTQSDGHGCALHADVCTSFGHSLPPYAATSTLRTRFFVPPAHVLVHGPYAAHGDTLQSTSVVKPT